MESTSSPSGHVQHLAFQAQIRQVMAGPQCQYVAIILESRGRADSSVATLGGQILIWKRDAAEPSVLLIPEGLAARCQLALAGTTFVILHELDTTPWPQVAATHAFDLSSGLSLWSLPGVEVSSLAVQHLAKVPIVPVQDPDAAPVWLDALTGEAASQTGIPDVQSHGESDLVPLEADWLVSGEEKQRQIVARLVELAKRGHLPETPALDGPLLWVLGSASGSALYQTERDSWVWLLISPGEITVLDWPHGSSLAEDDATQRPSWLAMLITGDLLLSTSSHELFWYTEASIDQS